MTSSPTAAEPDGATFEGKAGFRDAAADWTEDFSDWQVHPQEFTGLGEAGPGPGPPDGARERQRRSVWRRTTGSSSS